LNNSIAIRKYTSEDATTLNEMVTKVYGFTQDEGMWRWKYEDNPLKTNHSYVAVAGERIVAHTGGIGVELQNRGKKFFGTQLGDLMSDPEHRVKGAFSMAYLTQIQESVEEEFRPFGFANPNSTEHVVRSGLAMLGPPVPRLDKVINLEPFIRRKVKSPLLSYPLGFIANSVTKVLYSTRAPRLKKTQSITEIASFDESFDKLWERVCVDFPRTPVRSSRYLQWRYRRHPSHEYKVFGFFDAGELMGFIVLRMLEDEDITRGLIIDLITDLRRPEVGDALLTKGKNYLMKAGVDLITCWMFDHMPYHETLKKMYFVERNSDLTILIYGEQGKHDVDFLNDPKNWYVSMGDTDVW